MNAPIAWWANRKSRLGMKVSARRPPHLPGNKEWWTSPPISCPQPEYIEYAATFLAELQLHQSGMTGGERHALIKYVANWLKAARRLLHEEMQSPDRIDLHTTDGIIIAAASALSKMRSRIYGLGGTIDDEVAEICNAVNGRSDKLRRERAIGGKP